MMKVLLALGIALLACTACAKRPRQVTCDGTHKVIPDGANALYSLGLDVGELNFAALASMMGVAEAADLSELVTALNSLKGVVNNKTRKTLVMDVVAPWNATLTKLAATVAAEGETYAADGDNGSAALAFMRASAYQQLAVRFLPDALASSKRLFLQSVAWFVKATSFTNQATVAQCSPHFIPFGGSTMHSYWCPAAPGSVASPAAAKTVIFLTGFDGTAEELYAEGGVELVKLGYNVLLLEGPGQGYTVRINNLHFTPEYERPVLAAVNFVKATFGVSNSDLVLYGMSMGGYLAPRAFAHLPAGTFRGLVANGGVHDFYQGMLCKLPNKTFPGIGNPVENYLSGNPEKQAILNGMMKGLVETQFASSFAMTYGRLGFGPNVTSWSTMLDATEPYSFDATNGGMGGFAGKGDVFVYDPAWDGLMGNQSQIFFAALPRPLANTTALLQLDPYRGTGQHCAIGSQWNINIAIHRWLRALW
jgi:pimeloyl-ACP methyl ester carboxylesterase